MTSSWKRRSNRRNAQHSTGPRTDAGKERSSHNATTHGIFCNALVLEGESEQLMLLIRRDFIKRHNPQDLAELMLVDRMVAAAWKLRRLQEAELLLHASKSDQLKDFSLQHYEQM